MPNSLIVLASCLSSHMTVIRDIINSAPVLGLKAASQNTAPIISPGRRLIAFFPPVHAVAILILHNITKKITLNVWHGGFSSFSSYI